MRNILSVPIVLCLLISGVNSANAKWVKVDDQTSYSVDYDDSLVTSDATIRLILARMNYHAQQQVITGEYLGTIEMIIRLDCSKKTSRILKYTYYSKPDSKGDIFLTDISTKPEKPIKIPSPMNLLLMRVCIQS